MSRRGRGVGIVTMAVVLAIAATACTGGGDGDEGSREAERASAEAKEQRRQDAFAEVVDDPCSLLSPEEVADAFGVEQAAPLEDAAPRTCAFLVEPNGTLVVAVHQPQASERSANRTAGAEPLRGSDSVQVPTLAPGVLAFARNGRTLASVDYELAVDTLTIGPELLESVAQVVETVQRRLPQAPEPGEDPGERDLCDLGPVSALGDAFGAIQPATTFACAYGDDANTILRMSWLADEAPVSASSLLLPGGDTESVPWEAVGGGATWQGQTTSAEVGGSGRGEVPVGADRVLVVEATSSTRSLDELRALAASLAREVRQQAS